MGNLHELRVHGDLNYGTGIKQRINQQGWETFYPISLVRYMLKTDGSPDYIYLRRLFLDLLQGVVFGVETRTGWHLYVILR
jgi:hypothetical protein